MKESKNINNKINALTCNLKTIGNEKTEAVHTPEQQGLSLTTEFSFNNNYNNIVKINKNLYPEKDNDFECNTNSVFGINSSNSINSADCIQDYSHKNLTVSSSIKEEDKLDTKSGGRKANSNAPEEVTKVKCGDNTIMIHDKSDASFFSIAQSVPFISNIHSDKQKTSAEGISEISGQVSKLSYENSGKWKLGDNKRRRTYNVIHKCPFETCGKVFREKGNLRNHLRAHVSDSNNFFLPYYT